MRRIIADPTDGGYPFDSDLHQMTEGGCPLSPDPARWSDPEWRDVPTEVADPAGSDRPFRADTPPPAAAVPAPSHWQMRRNRADLAERWRAACERMAGGRP